MLFKIWQQTYACLLYLVITNTLYNTLKINVLSYWKKSKLNLYTIFYLAKNRIFLNIKGNLGKTVSFDSQFLSKLTSSHSEIIRLVLSNDSSVIWLAFNCKDSNSLNWGPPPSSAAILELKWLFCIHKKSHCTIKMMQLLLATV